MSFISYETSQNMLELLQVGSLRSEKVFLSDALGRILAKDIIAHANDPMFPTSAMDGFAVVHTDLADKKITILSEDNPAGSDSSGEVYEGVCIKTFTGSMMPEGADTLIPIENVSVEGNILRINESVPKGFSVRPVGESYSQGDVLITKGTKISYAEIGVLAGLNIVMVDVAIAPRVAVLATGSEILDLGEEATTASQIRSSNNYTLEALATLGGASVHQMGITKDDRVSIMESFENALACSDIVVSTGGVSVGDYDFVKDIIPRLGAEVIYKGVKIKPGQHIMVAQRNEKFIIALPGFAYSSTVTFILYVLPLIRRMLGRNDFDNIVEARLKTPFNKRSRKSEFTACNLSLEDGQYYVDFEGKKVGTSAILVNMLGSSALMVTGEDDGNLEEGTMVNVIRLDQF